MSNKIQSYINSSSPGRNRLPVPKKSFKSIYSQDRSIIVPTKPTDDKSHDNTHKIHTAALASELKQIAALKNNTADNGVASSVSSSTNGSEVSSSNNGSRSEVGASRDISRNNSCASPVESEDGMKEVGSFVYFVVFWLCCLFCCVGCVVYFVLFVIKKLVGCWCSCICCLGVGLLLM